jgi:hypothetical protein
VNNLHIEETANTPLIEFSATGKSLLFKGKSIPENTIKFYTPIKEWLEQYYASPASETFLDIHLEYFNTSSAKVIIDILKRLVHLNTEGKTKLKIIWKYDTNDSDMQEAGEDMMSLLKFDFEFLSVED